ncbi:lysozyme [Proteus mirabilis]|uniref:lysozyme n=1 Tax=Proteus mirabilis TaxID=584 RepID=UPI0018C659AB|nr:lysozyme [Proteus mirabilis]MBG5978582.1 lysozyme [Proteus mirabilis]MCW4519339.1 lysozyme [Proteus mirabilis]MDF7361137.1 lysozyme [Proteus mirabilis]UZE76046.1 lysozyme [Proteus mirabilis]UZE79747.1 lysozyme [Proteus mirabilis]
MNLKQKVTAVASAGAVSIALTVIGYFEGVRYEPYRDVAGILTVCYGHTGNDIIQGKTYTQQECDELLQKDFIRTQQQVDILVKVPVDDKTKAALYSFAFNVGTTAFGRSTLLNKLNAGDQNGACEEMKRWVYAGGKVWRGLVSRREAESALCNGSL